LTNLTYFIKNLFCCHAISPFGFALLKCNKEKVGSQPTYVVQEILFEVARSAAALAVSCLKFEPEVSNFPVK